MRSHRSLALTCWALLVLSGVSCSQETPEFEDPKPPAVRSAPRAVPPEATATPDLTFLRAPKPRAKGAVNEDWPSFLGPRRDARSRETSLLEAWPEAGPAKVWEAALGSGYAPPSVAGGRLLVAHRVGDVVFVDCRDPGSGKRFWRHERPCTYAGQYIRDGGPRATPVIDEERVFVHGVDGVLECLDIRTGFVCWRRDLRKEFALREEFFGVVGTPLVHGDALYINLGARDEGPVVAAFAKATGRLLWGAGTGWGASCASPVVAEIHGRSRLLVLAGGRSRPPKGGLMVLDPKTGALDFTHPFRSRTYTSVVATTPVILGNDVFLTAAYNLGCATLRLDAKGGFNVVASSRRHGIQFGNVVAHDGHVFLLEGKQGRSGDLVCLDPGTAKEVHRTDLDREETVLRDGREVVRTFSFGEGSMTFADGDLFCLSDEGHLARIRADRKGAKVLARATLFRARDAWTPPVICNGLLYVRQNTRDVTANRGPRLICYDLRGGK